MPEYKIELPPLYPLQAEIARAKVRFKVICAGRRAGKTRLCATMAIKRALEGGYVWWVGPYHKQAQIGWKELTAIARQIPDTKILLSEKRIEFCSGGIIEVRSADNPDNLRGAGLDLIIIDEAAFIKKGVWTEALRPTLSDRQGRAVLISTPKGRNEFFRLFQKGLKGEDDWQSWTFPSSANPFIPKEEWEIAKKELPEDVYRQEILAQFLDDSAGVFRNVKNCIKPIVSLNKNSVRSYVMGVDLAKSRDYTAIVIMDRKTGEVIKTYRWNKIDWLYTKRKIVEIAKQYKAQVLVDETGVGNPVVEDLKRESINIKGFIFTNSSKKELINDLQVAFETARLTISPSEKTLIEEIQIYEYEMTARGNITYNAPAGGHDDMVIALALAYSLTSKSLQKGMTSVFLAR